MNKLRMKKLRMVVDHFGGAANFCRQKVSPDADKPVDPSHISQILNGHRKFGETAARNMEARTGLPDGYFDSEDMKPESEVFIEDDEYIKQIIKKLQSQPKGSVKINIMRMIEMLIEGGEDSASKIENIYAFVEQKKSEHSTENNNQPERTEEQSS
jgi:hypothetical protein